MINSNYKIYCNFISSPYSRWDLLLNEFAHYPYLKCLTKYEVNRNVKATTKLWQQHQDDRDEVKCNLLLCEKG